MIPAYCSPEQAEAAAKRKAGTPREHLPKLTRRTDIWSCAASVLHLFLGKIAWPAGQVAPLVLQHEPDEPHLPAMLPAVKDLLRTCLQKRPEDRPHDLGQVADALQAIYQQIRGQPYPREKPNPGEALADTLNNRALSLFDLGQAADAERLWEEALGVDPNHPDATYNRGLIRWRAGRLDDLKLLGRLREARASAAVLAGWTT